MKEEVKKGHNRRDFQDLSAIGLTGLALLPSYMINGVWIPPGDRVLMGAIGLGRQALSDFRGFAGAAGLQIVACSEPSLIPAEIAGNRPQPRGERPAGQRGQRPAAQAYAL
jgi:hypothetical protein